MVGTIFRQPDFDDGIESWQAVLLVDHDPIAVYDTYAAQAREAGFSFAGSGGSIETPGGQTFRTCEVARDGSSGTHGADVFRCSGGGERREGDRVVTADLELRWGSSDHHAVLTVRRFKTATYPTRPDNVPFPGEAQLPADTPLPTAEIDKQPDNREGAAFGATNDAFETSYARFRLEHGSRLAAPEAYLISNQDFVAVLRVDGDTEKVMRGYARQLGEGRKVIPVKRVKVPGGEHVLYVSNSPSGGGFGQLLSDPSGRWLLVETHSD